MVAPDGGAGLSRYTFQQILTAAVTYIAENGFEDADELDQWLMRLRIAAEREVGTPERIDAAMRDALGAIYGRLVDRGGIAKYAPDVPRYTLAMVRPQLRAELDRRILASAGLIKIHRAEVVEKTLQRFTGWSTSIPPGGDPTVDKVDVKKLVGKSLKDFRYSQRRVSQDQGHKLISNIANIVAVDTGAIAGEWHSHWRRPGYDGRKEHKERDERVYAIKGSWAVAEGLINRGAGYLEDMTAAGQEVNCTCFVTYISSPRRVPEEMLTAKGKEWVAKGKAK